MDLKPVKRISRIEDDVSVVVCVWGPAYKDTTHAYFVRGKQVSRTSVTEESNGRMYRWCVMPDYTVQKINEGNIVSKRLTRGVVL